MLPILRIIRHISGLVLRSPALLIEYWYRKRQFEKEFADTIDHYPFTPEAKQELLDELKELNLKNIIKTVKTPGH